MENLRLAVVDLAALFSSVCENCGVKHMTDHVEVAIHAVPVHVVRMPMQPKIRDRVRVRVTVQTVAMAWPEIRRGTLLNMHIALQFSPNLRGLSLQASR